MNGCDVSERDNPYVITTVLRIGVCRALEEAISLSSLSIWWGWGLSLGLKLEVEVIYLER